MRADEAGAHVSAASTGEGGRNLPGTGAGAEARTAAGGRTKPEALRLMEAAVERSNLLCAYERVVKNQGAPGVDGLKKPQGGVRTQGIPTSTAYVNNLTTARFSEVSAPS